MINDDNTSEMYSILNNDNLNYNNLSNIDFNSNLEKFHYLCNKCKEIPKISFIKRNIINYICQCEESHKREINIKNALKYLVNSDNENNIENKLKCLEHKEPFNYYCKFCNNQNLCEKCYYNHNETHKKKIIGFKQEKIIELRIKFISEKIKKYNDDNNFINSNVLNIHNNNSINENNLNIELIEINDQIEESEESNKQYYFELFQIILNDYSNYPNYIHFDIISNIENFIIYFYEKPNEMKLTYEFNKDILNNNNIELFGDIFVDNNNEECFLVINDKILNLKKSIKLEDVFDNKLLSEFRYKIEVKLIEKNSQTISNLSFMFNGISYLQSLSFNSINDKVTNMSYMFYNCKLLTELSGFSELNTFNVIDMSHLFYNCESLTSLPNISKWNMNNVIDMSYMFYNCVSLISLPDISIWNTNKVKDMRYMFYNCSSLKEFPDISNWNINNVNNASFMFYGCSSLTSITFSSILNLYKIKDNSYIFYNCKSIIIPNISELKLDYEDKTIDNSSEESKLLTKPVIINEQSNIKKCSNKLIKFLSSFCVIFSFSLYLIILFILFIFRLI